jgi:multidrug transporter EmrE-like cation transporter
MWPVMTGGIDMRYVAALVLALLLNACANLMIKFGANRLGQGDIFKNQHGIAALWSALVSNWVLALGLVCFATNVLFYTYALKKIPISLAYPIMVCSGFTIIAVVAWKYLGENLSPAQWVGIGFILLGLVLVARGMAPAVR